MAAIQQAQQPEPQPAPIPVVQPSAKARFPSADPVTSVGFPALPPKPEFEANAARFREIVELRRQLCSETWRRLITDMERPGARSKGQTLNHSTKVFFETLKP